MAVTKLPRAMLIDMDDTILSAYGRPEIAWNHIAAEFADEFSPLPPQQLAAALLTFARNFWSTAEPAWRLKLGEARRITVQGGFDALAANGHARLPADLAIRIADRFSRYREEEMFIFPARTMRLTPCARSASSSRWSPTARPTHSAPRSSASSSRIASTTSRSRASTVSASRRSAPICMPWTRSASPRRIPG